jgi:hypothetical protein
MMPTSDLGRESRQLRLDEPVIVLTCARSGSTLLRFVLDTHPALAAPPENGIVDLCGRMEEIWKILDGGTGESPGAAVRLARHWADQTFGPYLALAGKERWCDKTICTASSAGNLEFFLSMYPKARFICLYRNCMDVVSSVLEATPWGVRGYGLEPFVVNNPGNSVAAIADYWTVHTRSIATFEQAHPEACLRVRYEDFVTEPETQVGRIFGFLGEPEAPGIVTQCFTAERHLGPGDYKILATQDIHQHSIGRGRRVPPQLISPPTRQQMNDLLADLGYALVDQNWRANGGTGTAVLSAFAGPGARTKGDRAAGDEPGSVGQFQQLESALAARVANFQSRERLCGANGSGQIFTVTAKIPGGQQGSCASRSWSIDLDHRTVSLVETADAEASPHWGAIAAVGVWRSIIEGGLNVGTALKQGELLYKGMQAHDGGSNPLRLWADLRMRILAQLLSTGPDGHELNLSTADVKATD